MKYLNELTLIAIFTIALWLACTVANAITVDRESHNVCNQRDYDLIYSTIVKATLKSNLTPDDIKTRNDSIEMLRELCEGQLSSFERGGRE